MTAVEDDGETSFSLDLRALMIGALAAFVGVASSFAILLEGFTAVGASPAQAASALFAVSFAMGALSLILSLSQRLPITIAWSTPGAALLVSTGMPAGGYAGGFGAVVGALIAAAGLMIVAGLWRPFGRAIEAIPKPVANAMLAGVLFELCLAPVRAVAELPLLALPVVIVWAVAYRFARLYAVPLAVAVAAAGVVLTVDFPAGAFAEAGALPVLTAPTFTLETITGIALPLFIVTMASQNIPGLAVLSANGYRPSAGPLFAWTGFGSLAAAPFGGHGVNLAAITAALCAGPEAHPDPRRRWLASAGNGVASILFAFGAGAAAAFIAASPPILITAVAGLALIGSFGSAAADALSDPDDRIPAAITFLVTTSGIAVLGVGAAFWGLAAGGAVMALLRIGR